MYLIGTLHLDVKGPERLEKLLKYLNPASVSLEWPVASGSLEPSKEELLSDVRHIDETIEQSVKYVEDVNLPENVKQCCIRGLQSALYEVKVPLRLSDSLGHKIYCVEYPPLRESRFAQTPSLDVTKIFTPQILENIKKLSAQEVFEVYSKYCDRIYQNPAMLDDEASFMPPGLVENMEKFKDEREQFMAETIKRLTPHVHIGGLLHTYLELPTVMKYLVPHRTLAYRIRHLRPKTFELIEADSIPQIRKPRPAQ